MPRRKQRVLTCLVPNNSLTPSLTREGGRLAKVQLAAHHARLKAVDEQLYQCSAVLLHEAKAVLLKGAGQHNAHLLHARLDLVLAARYISRKLSSVEKSTEPAYFF